MSTVATETPTEVESSEPEKEAENGGVAVMQPQEIGTPLYPTETANVGIIGAILSTNDTSTMQTPREGNDEKKASSSSTYVYEEEEEDIPEKPEPETEQITEKKVVEEPVDEPAQNTPIEEAKEEQPETNNDSLNETCEEAEPEKTEIAPEIEESSAPSQIEESPISVEPLFFVPAGPTEQEIEDAYEILRKYKTAPHESIADCVLHFVNRKKVDALYASDYDEAEELDKLAGIITNGNTASLRKKASEERSYEMDMRNIELKEKYKTKKEFWLLELDRNERECDAKLTELEEKHERELQEFKARWQSPEYIKQFNKPSVRLLQLRHIEKKLALQRQYTEAKQMKKIADGVQKQEEAEVQKGLEERMKTDYTKMRERHATEIKKMEGFYETREQELRMKMKKEIDPMEKAMRTLETKKASPMTNRQFVHYRKVVAEPGQLSMQGNSPLQTPRTVQKYTRYREERNGSLNLTPMAEDIFSKLPTTSSRTRKKRPQTATSSRLPRIV